MCLSFGRLGWKNGYGYLSVNIFSGATETQKNLQLTSERTDGWMESWKEGSGLGLDLLFEGKWLFVTVI